MSFDTEFDYNSLITNLTQQNVINQGLIDGNTAKLTLLQNSSYVNLLTNDINALIADNANKLEYITNNQDVLNEIMRILSLSVEQKTLLYYFYTILKITKNNYMIKILFNTDAVNDPNVQTVYNDTVSTNEVKLMVAEIIYRNFTINSKCRNLMIYIN